MQRKHFSNGDVTLSYLDVGGDGKPVIALHAYWMEAGTWTALAGALAPKWRLIALDLRGHGHSDKPDDLSWDAFIGDLEALLDHLGIVQPVALIGNSLGGTVAFRFAARRPDSVAAMVIEESPAVENANLDFMRAWAGVFPSREALAEAIGTRLLWSVEPSFRHVDGGWTLVFSATQLADALPGLNGDFWDDWLATKHPVMLVRGTDSRAVNGELLSEMARRRPATRLETLDAGHVTHHDAPAAFANLTRAFLADAANRVAP
ncbi:MAG: alpha/beta hydrolase [Tahibacter sp.]